MTQEEAIVYFEKILAGAKQGLEEHPEEGKRGYGMRKELAEIALSVLCPVSREQVEKVWRGEWERITDPYGKLEGFLCKCGTQTYSASNFCPHCGGAKTDEAVDRVMKRLEQIKCKN